jgi:hypothetical protein
MNVVSFAVGVLLVGFGFVTLIHKLHDRTMHESLVVLRYARGGAARTVLPLVSTIAPIVTSIAGGIALLAAALLGGRVSLL